MNSGLSLSFELVYLLNWLLKHKKPALIKLVQQAVKDGFTHDLFQEYAHIDDLEHAEELYEGMIQFLVLLENHVLKNLDNAIEPVPQVVNGEILDASLQQARIELARAKGVQEDQPVQADEILLFKQLLEQWKPAKNEPLN